jgi:hypothetical protein
MKTKSRATAAAASTDAAAAVAERSNPRGIAKKRHGRFLPRALSSVLASLSKLKLGTRTPPVSSKKKTTAAPVPRAEKPSSRAKRARSRRARAMRPAPEPARKPAPGSEQAVARSSAKSDTRAGRKNKKNAEKKKQTTRRAPLDGVHQRAAVTMKRPAKPRNAREKRREKKTRDSENSEKRAPCPSAPVVTTRAVMRRYARSAFARDCTRFERDALVQQGFPAVDTHGSLLDAKAAPSRATRAEEERKKKRFTKKKRRAKRASRGATEAFFSPPSSLPRADSMSMVFSPLVRCDDDDFGTTDARDEGHAARLPAEVFGGRGDHPREDAWLDSDPEGDDDAWERGSARLETRDAFETRDAILRSPVAWTPASPPRRPRGARR